MIPQFGRFLRPEVHISSISASKREGHAIRESRKASWSLQRVCSQALGAIFFFHRATAMGIQSVTVTPQAQAMGSELFNFNRPLKAFATRLKSCGPALML